MKKFSKIAVTVIIALVIIGLTLPLINIFAQENLQAPLKEVENKVDELVQLKDNSTLSDKEKEIKEIQIRKESLAKIADLSLLEIKNLEDKINALELESKDQIAIKEIFLNILENNKKYSEELKKKNEKENISLDEVKNLAQEYKDWRQENYDKYIKELTVFVLTFQEKQVLKTANTRLDKIMSDLKKLETAKILKKEDTWNLVNASMKSLTNAQTFNSKGENLIINLIKKNILISASSTLLIENASSTLATTTKSLFTLASTTAASDQKIKTNIASSTASSTPKIISDEDKAQTWIEKSLQEIKNAYNSFLSISDKVKLKLKIK